MFTKQFKVLIAVILAVFVAGLVFLNQFLDHQQLTMLKTRVDQLQFKPVVKVMPTATPSATPTATPSAGFKKLLPTWTPTPEVKK